MGLELYGWLEVVSLYRGLFLEIFSFDGAERANTIITSTSMTHIIVAKKNPPKLSLSVGDRVL